MQSRDPNKQPQNAPPKQWAATSAPAPPSAPPRVLGATPGGAAYGQRHSRYSRLIPDLRPGEIVVVVQRRHIAVLMTGLVVPVLMLAAWLVGLFFVLPFVAGLQTDPLLAGGFGGPTAPSWLPAALTLLYLALAGLLLLWMGYIFLQWKDDWLALTTRRLIVMDKMLFIRETRREVPISKVQNIVADYPRVLSMSLDFGDLTVDTAGVGVLKFHDLPHPRSMREAIFAQQSALKANQPPPEDRRRAAIRNLLQGADPLAHSHPTPPNGYPRLPGRGETQLIDASLVSGYGPFNKIFPFVPQRASGGVTWHKHWVFLVRGLLLPSLIYAVALIAWLGLRVSGLLAVSDLLDGILSWIAVLLLPVCTVWALWNWEDWRNDLYRLDHERLYHIESLPFGLREESKETLVSRITDVSYTVPGPLAHLLNFGNVVIKTPGESTEFLFRGIPHPREVQGEIMARLDEHRLKDNAGMDREIEAWIKAYDEVKRNP